MSASSDPRGPVPDPSSRRVGALYWALLCATLLAALWLRTDDLLAWRNHPQRAFHKNQPILINFDGYYYLSLARDLLNHEYTGADRLRGVPQPPTRPIPPPMLSMLAAAVSAATPLSLNWSATLLPPILGITLAVPLWLLGRLLGGRMMALVAVALGLFADYYLYRSHLGWFDTDFLNVTLLLVICYFFIRFGLQHDLRRFYYLGAGFLAYLFFLIWWDQTPAIVSLLSLTPLGIVVVLHYRPTGRERWAVLTAAGVALLALLVWLGPRDLTAPVREAFTQWGYIAKKQAGDFPNVGVSVLEQKALDFSELVQRTTANWFTFGLGVAGLGWLFCRRWRTVAPLIIPLGLGCLSLFLARRFLIFLVPMLALGVGYMAQRLWERRLQQPWLRQAVPIAIVAALIFPVRQSAGRTYWPKIMPQTIEGMQVLEHSTATDAVIWAWWDSGYPLIYWSGRATINDGSLHGGLLTVVNAIPLVAEEPRVAAGFIHFYVARGIEGLQRVFAAAGGSTKGMAVIEAVLAAGPDNCEAPIAQAGLMPFAEWRRFFFPEDSPEIYLFLDLRLARTTYWWSWFGTWDANRRDGIHSRFKLFTNCRRAGDIIEGPDLRVDLKNGRATHEGRAYPLQTARVLSRPDGFERTYASEGLFLSYDPASRIAALMDPEFARTLFSRLYILNEPDPACFSPHSARMPYYQIWKVHNPAAR
jgi:hypothetical protein